MSSLQVLYYAHDDTNTLFQYENNAVCAYEHLGVVPMKEVD